MSLYLDSLRDGTSGVETSDILQLRAMYVLARSDPGMKDLLDRAREFYILKGSPSMSELLQAERKKQEGVEALRYMLGGR